MLLLGVVEHRQSFGGLFLLFKQQWPCWLRDLQLSSDAVMKCCTDINYISLGLHFLTYKDLGKEDFLVTIFILL